MNFLKDLHLSAIAYDNHGDNHFNLAVNAERRKCAVHLRK
jgi:hypothetical protein